MTFITPEACRDYRTWMAAKCAEPVCLPMDELVARFQSYFASSPHALGHTSFDPREVGMTVKALHSVISYIWENDIPLEVDGERYYLRPPLYKSPPASPDQLRAYCRDYGRGRVVCLEGEE